MIPQDQAIRRFQQRLATVLFLRNALQFLAIYAFVWGSTVLVLRANRGMPRLPLLWGLAGLPCALVPAWYLARRKLPAAEVVRALLDQRGHCGGLLMAGAEQPLGNWQQSLPAVASPRLAWDGRRTWGIFLTSAAFVAACFLLPNRIANLSGAGLDISREANKLKRQIDVLKEETILDPVRADLLNQKLEQVRAEASGRNPAKTLEALDHLENLAAKAAQSAAEAAGRKNGQMTKVDAAAQAMQKAGPAMEPEKKTKAMAELAKLVEKAAEENDLLRKKMKDNEADVTEGGAGDFNAEQLKRLSRAMKEAKGDLKKRLEKLQKEGLLSSEDLQKCDCDGDLDAEALAKFLEENKGDSLEKLLSKCEKPGKGGVTEGPGASDIAFGDESSKDGVKWKEQALPAPALRALKQSQLTAVSTGDPKKGGGIAGSGALEGAAIGGGSASTPVVLPRHRALVERYFDRAKKEK